MTVAPHTALCPCTMTRGSERLWWNSPCPTQPQSGNVQLVRTENTTTECITKNFYNVFENYDDEHIHTHRHTYSLSLSHTPVPPSGRPPLFHTIFSWLIAHGHKYNVPRTHAHTCSSLWANIIIMSMKMGHRITSFLYFQKPNTNNKITCSTENVSTCFNAATTNSTAQL